MKTKINLKRKNQYRQKNSFKPQSLNIMRKQAYHQQEFHWLLKIIFSYWFTKIIAILTIIMILSKYFHPEFIENNEQDRQLKHKLIIAVKATLIYSFLWVLIFIVHTIYRNQFKIILQIDNPDAFIKLLEYSFKMSIFFFLTLHIPCNQSCIRIMAILLLYSFFSQKYVRFIFLLLVGCLIQKKCHFLSKMFGNHLISLQILVNPMISLICPFLEPISLFIALFLRMTLSFIANNRTQYLNSIKYLLNIFAHCFAMYSFSNVSLFLKIICNIYSFYWDIFMDFKLYQRFFIRKNYRIDLPLPFLIIVSLWDLIARVSWMIFPFNSETRGFNEQIRRLIWTILRIQREQVYNRPKPRQNVVKTFL